MREFLIGVCPVCGGLAHHDVPCHAHREHAQPREIVKAVPREDFDRLYKALDALAEVVERVDVEGQIGDVDDLEDALDDARDALDVVDATESKAA